MGGGDQDDWVTAQQDGGAPEEAAVGVEEGALPGELVLLGHGPAQDPLVTLPATSGRIFQSFKIGMKYEGGKSLYMYHSHLGPVGSVVVCLISLSLQQGRFLVVSNIWEI